jgi:WD40 repeat protein
MEPSLSPIRSLRGHARLVQEVVFLKYENHLRVISTSDDATVRIWDVDTGNQVGSPLEGYGSANVGVSIDGRRIVSGTEDGKIIIWDADTKDIINVLSHHTRQVDSVQFSPDEKTLTSASYDGALKIWDVETGELLCESMITLADYGQWRILPMESRLQVDRWIVQFASGVQQPVSNKLNHSSTTRRTECHW